MHAARSAEPPVSTWRMKPLSAAAPRWRPTARNGSIPDGRWVSTLSQMIPKTVIDEAPSTATRTYRNRADPRPAPPRTARLRDGASSPVPPTSPTASCPGSVRCQSGGSIHLAPDHTPVPTSCTKGRKRWLSGVWSDVAVTSSTRLSGSGVFLVDVVIWGRPSSCSAPVTAPGSTPVVARGRVPVVSGVAGSRR